MIYLESTHFEKHHEAQAQAKEEKMEVAELNK